MKKNKNKFSKIIKKIIAVLLLIVISLSIYIIKSGYDMYKNALSTCPIDEKIQNVSSVSSYVTLDKIPSTYKDAVIAVEDKRFYIHKGIDIISISRAIIKDIASFSLMEGGSTITQQVAKNLYLSQEKKFSRKIAEFFIATELEKKLSKDKILELYLNIIYYGDGYYGIGNASYGYFNKHPSELTLYEQTLIVGIPNAPAIYQLSNNSNLTYERQSKVISTMAEAGKLTNKDIDIINNEKNTLD